MISTITIRRKDVRRTAVAASCMLLLASLTVAADGDKPAAGQPADISVGEPISLPVPPATGRKPVADAATPGDADPVTASPPAGAAVPQAVVPGNGWLGLTAEESTQPGRWVVADVAAHGPAAAAGIRVGDELRAINGTTLSNAEELAQSMTSFAAGQDVRLAIGRGAEVVDVVVRAGPRPPAAAKPNWQPATAGPATSPAEPASPPSGAVASASSPPSGVPAADAAPAAAPPAAGFAPPAAAAAPQPSAPEAFRSAVVDAPAPLPGPSGSRWRTPDFAPAAEPSRLATDPPADRLPATAEPVGAGAAENAAVAATAAPRIPDQRVGNGRPALGVRTLPIDAGMQARFRLTQPTGAYVLGVVQDLPASRAGVPPGSVIVALGDQPVHTPADLTRLVTGGPVGRPVSLEYVLPGGEERRADVVLQPLELPLQRALVGPEPTTVPTLQRAERPVSAAAPEPAVNADAVRQEIRFLRQRLERLEQWLERRPAVNGSAFR
jgi:S1-C subfamily serine protease